MSKILKEDCIVYLSNKEELSRKTLEILGTDRGWSAKSIRRKVQNSQPFVWIEKVHFIREGDNVVAINIDAVFRSLWKV